MPPIGQSILLWRNTKGLTQSELAIQSGVSRPNLSAIEQGARDLTLETLRRIALVLGVSAGTLVDGIGPSSYSKSELNRYALDRIARLAAGQSLRASDKERRIASDLQSLMTSKIRRTHSENKRGSIRAENAVVLRLKSEIGVDIFKHLVRRVEKNLTSRFMAHE